MANSGWQIISAILYTMNFVLAIYAATSLILRKHDPVKTLSWICVLILLPYIGLILYFFFGLNNRKKKMFSRKGFADLKAKKEISKVQREAIIKDPNILGKDLVAYKKIILQNIKSGGTIIESNSKIDFYFTGRDALDAMYNSIQNAKKHIHLQSYIIENDNIGKKFAALLKQKATQGVEVRIIYDGLGSYKLSEEFIKNLTDAGVEMLCFSPVKLLALTSKLNYRNHRKILVIDGEEGFLGGVNIADRYYYGNSIGDWHDTHIKVRGESVKSLQLCFLLDRYFIKNHKIRRRKKYYPEIDLPSSQNGTTSESIFSQTIISGPDSSWASIMQCYFSTITSALNHIYIVTPYFTPNESILNAIKTAALSSIDVRIMLPETSDTKISHYSTMSYISELLDAGVKIYLFKKGFNHSKVVSIDGKMSIVGSANMDVRSFEHNFEIMQVLYNSTCAQTIEKNFLHELKSCRQINSNIWSKRSKKNKILESLARLCSPLL